MKKELNEVINKLDNYLDKIYCSPLTKEEVEIFEKNLNIKFPDYFITFLERIGIFQDLIIKDIFETKGQYISEKEFINKNLQKEDVGFFPFGNNGYGDLFLLKDKTHQDDYIYKYYHDTGKLKKTKENFVEYIEKAIIKAIKEYKKRKLNNEKNWAIQLTFETPNEDKLLEQLECFNMVLIGNWELTEKYPSGVIEYKKSIMFRNEQLFLKKTEYKEWENPNYSLNINIPLLNKEKRLAIEKIDFLLKKTENLNYKLLSYGIL